MTAYQWAPRTHIAGERPPHMDVLDSAMFVLTNEHSVVLAGAFIEQMGVGESRHHLRVDATSLAEVSEHPPHISISGGWGQVGFLFLLLGWSHLSSGPYALRHIVQLRDGTSQMLGHTVFPRVCQGMGQTERGTRENQKIPSKVVPLNKESFCS